MVQRYYFYQKKGQFIDDFFKKVRLFTDDF